MRDVEDNMKDNLDIKIDFIKAIESIGIKYGTYKLIVRKKGKYGKPEAWIYKKYTDGVKGIGYLIEEETLSNKDFLREYLSDFL